jgi:ATP/maltotriose-dependent transcriptional regulator MalT
MPDCSEADGLLRAGALVDTEQRDVILDRTEGWAAALYLVALAM